MGKSLLLVITNKKNMKKKIIKEIERYMEWVSDELADHRNADRVMLLYDMDSRYVAAKQILKIIEKIK
jgi:hypothetical protein